MRNKNSGDADTSVGSIADRYSDEHRVASFDEGE